MPPSAPDATAAPGDNDSVTISYAVWDYEQQLYEPLAKKFMAEHPNITVALVSLDDMMNVPQQQQTAQEGPLTQLRRIVSGADTAPAFALTPEAFGSGLMLDLAPLMDADSSFKRDDFLPGALEQYASKGGTWVLPRYLNVQVLSYNKDLFKAAGLPEPKAGWTWTDLLGTAEQLGKKSGSKVDTYGYLDSSGGFLPLIALLQDQSIDLLNTPSQQVKLDSPAVLAAVKRLRTLVDGGALFRPEYKEGADPVDPGQLIRDGKVAIWGQEFVQVADGPGATGQPSRIIALQSARHPTPAPSRASMAAAPMAILSAPAAPTRPSPGSGSSSFRASRPTSPAAGRRRLQCARPRPSAPIASRAERVLELARRSDRRRLQVGDRAPGAAA